MPRQESRELLVMFRRLKCTIKGTYPLIAYRDYHLLRNQRYISGSTGEGRRWIMWSVLWSFISTVATGSWDGVGSVLEGLTGRSLTPKVIFQIALKANASSLILAHNHPSGNCVPSEADNRLTEKLKKAGGFLDLPILDHLILTSETYYSFADENTL